MKFRYEYRTSDNIRHTDVVAAKNRDAVFAILAKRGIRPGRVEIIPDPWRKIRIAAFVSIALSSVAIAAVAFLNLRMVASPMSRRQIYGDPVLIERGACSDWQDVLSDPTDRYLARYAQPGWSIRVQKDIGERSAVAAVLSAGVEATVKYADEDLMEFRQLKRIVAGLRREAAAFVRAGGTAERYLELLDERQAKESAIFSEHERKLSEASEGATRGRLYEIWIECNRRLKSMGLKQLPLPEKAAETFSNFPG